MVQERLKRFLFIYAGVYTFEDFTKFTFLDARTVYEQSEVRSEEASFVEVKGLWIDAGGSHE